MLNKFYFCLVFCFGSIQLVSGVTTADSNNVTALNDSDFENFIQKADKPVIIDFWAKWCGPCMTVKPVFEQVANELNGKYLFVSVNIDEGQQIAKKYNIVSIPTFKIIKNNTVVGTFMGCHTNESFKAQISDVIDNKINLERLISAIQADDKDLVAICLNDKDVDVNGTIQIETMNISVPMTPLMVASARVMYGQASTEIVFLLLKAGANMDLETRSPELDKSHNVVGWGKTSARKIVEANAKERSKEKLDALSEPTREKVLEMNKKALNLLKLFEEFKPKQENKI